MELELKNAISMLIGTVIGVFLTLALYRFSPVVSDMIALFDEGNRIKAECEKSLARDQHCEIKMFARVSKNKTGV